MLTKHQGKGTILYGSSFLLFRISTVYGLVLMQEWRPVYVKLDSR